MFRKLSFKLEHDNLGQNHSDLLSKHDRFGLDTTDMLRKRGVVGQFVEFCGSGCKNLSLTDRATIANMSPEYGATMGFFPVDDQTIKYLESIGTDPHKIKVITTYLKAQGLYD
jgi:aconitate hydratase